MRPSVSQMLMGAAANLNRDIAPSIQPGSYAIGQAGTIGLLMVLMAQESDRAVDTLVNEQDAIRALFAEAARASVPDDLRLRLAEAAARSRTSLRISDLEGETALLNELLIELHAWLETSKFDWAEALESRVWEILKLGADCRALYLPTL